MAKTTDRQVVNGQEYMIMDSAAREAVTALKDEVGYIGEQIQPCRPVLFAYMRTDGTIVDRLTINDYKIDMYDVSKSKFIVLDGDGTNDSDFPCVMFLQDNVLAFGETLNLSAIDPYMMNNEASECSGSSYSFDRMILPVPEDCNFVLVQNYNRTIKAYGYGNSKKVETYGAALVPYKTIQQKYWSKETWQLVNNLAYQTRIYNVEDITEFYIHGGSQGTRNVIACGFTSYDPEEESRSGMIYCDFIVWDSSASAQYYNTDRKISVPDDAIYFITVSVPNNNNDLIIYECTDLMNVVRDMEGKNTKRVVNCIGDSLTMGAADIIDGNRVIYPYSEKLQELLGDDYDVTNQGIGGEGTLEIGARLNGINAILENDITIPYNRAWVPLGVSSSDGVLSSWDDSNITLLLQGGELQGVYETGPTNYRAYYALINGVECVFAYMGNKYQIVRKTESADPEESIPCYAGTPIVLERMRKSREPLCNIYWCGTNDSDKSTLVTKLLAMISYQNNENYIVVGLHNSVAGVFTSEMRTAYRRAFGVRFFDLDLWTRTSALEECGITPTSADTTAINNGVCPPSLLSDNVHFKKVVYEALAVRFKEKMIQIGVID